MTQSHYLTILHIALMIILILLKLSLVVLLLYSLHYIPHSGMVSGGKLFNSAFGLDYHIGLILVSVIVIAYTFFGGI